VGWVAENQSTPEFCLSSHAFSYPSSVREGAPGCAIDGDLSWRNHPVAVVVVAVSDVLGGFRDEAGVVADQATVPTTLVTLPNTLRVEPLLLGIPHDRTISIMAWRYSMAFTLPQA